MMDKLRDYNIAFKGLANGKHYFTYEIESSFFENFENSIIKKGNFNVELELNKKIQLLELNFSFNGKIITTCDKCLGELIVPIKQENVFFVKFGKSNEDVDEKTVIISYDEYEINVADYIYQLVTVSLPIRNVHENDEDCDLQMIENINKYLADNNAEDINNNEIDPRWAVLQNLKR